MKKTIIVFLLSLMMGSAFAADNVRIVPYWERPIAYGSLKDVSDGQMFMIPNGTKGVVLKWNQNYSKLKDPFARLDMYERTQVKIINGPFEERCFSSPMSISRCSKLKINHLLSLI